MAAELSEEDFMQMLSVMMEDDYVDRFVRRMVEVAGNEFENGQSISEYARQRAKFYLSDPSHKGKASWECADVDVASWSDSGRTIARVEMMQEGLRLIQSLLSGAHVPRMPVKEARAVALEVAEILSAFPVTPYPPLKHAQKQAVAVKLRQLRTRRPELAPFMQRSFAWAGCPMVPPKDA